MIAFDKFQIKDYFIPIRNHQKGLRDSLHSKSSHRRRIHDREHVIRHQTVNGEHRVANFRPSPQTVTSHLLFFFRRNHQAMTLSANADFILQVDNIQSS